MAVLPTNVQPVITAVPDMLNRPPPKPVAPPPPPVLPVMPDPLSPLAWFSEIMELVMNKSPELKIAPPHPPRFVLLIRVQLRMVNSPALAIPAPFA